MRSMHNTTSQSLGHLMPVERRKTTLTVKYDAYRLVFAQGIQHILIDI